MAQEERLNDVFVLKRVSDAEADAVTQEGRWPKNLEMYEELLEIGKVNGHAARYADHLEMLPIAIDLLGQRPSLSVADFARLGNIDHESAEEVLLLAKAELEKTPLTRIAREIESTTAGQHEGTVIYGDILQTYRDGPALGYGAQSHLPCSANVARARS